MFYCFYIRSLYLSLLELVDFLLKNIDVHPIDNALDVNKLKMYFALPSGFYFGSTMLKQEWCVRVS